MGSGEESGTTGKGSKSSASVATAASQEAPATPLYSEWGPSLQAFYGAGAGAPPQAFFPPSPSPHHPFVWGSQHLIPAYGTPIPFSPVYAHGGMYAHPSMAAGTPYPAVDVEGRPSDGKEQGSAKKKVKVGTGAVGDAGPGKSGDGSKATSGSMDEDATQSEYEVSSEAKDESDEQQDLGPRKINTGTFADVESSQHVTGAQCSSTTTDSTYGGKGQPASKLPVLAPGRTVVPGPATNLNIGMDLWNSPHADPAVMKARPTGVSIAPAMASAAMVGRKGLPPEQAWMQDERELKRQKRKQSNRESARRSRLRKQQECEDLARKVDQLNNENSALRTDIEQLNKDCKDLESENVSIMEELKRLHGEDVCALESANRVSSKGLSTDAENGGQVHRSSNCI